jgi:transposase
LLCGVDSRAYLADISKIVNGHLSSKIDDLLPWAYPKAEPLKDVA